MKEIFFDYLELFTSICGKLLKNILQTLLFNFHAQYGELIGNG
jgi:hypothetical protein